MRNLYFVERVVNFRRIGGRGQAYRAEDDDRTGESAQTKYTATESTRFHASPPIQRHARQGTANGFTLASRHFVTGCTNSTSIRDRAGGARENVVSLREDDIGGRRGASLSIMPVTRTNFT